MSTPISELPYNTVTNSVSNGPAPSSHTELPARDIPRETINHTADPQVTTNYLPPKQPQYIEQQIQYQPQPSKTDKLLEEFKIPILLSVLYFIFQLPSVTAFIIRLLPSVALNHELTMTGIAVKSILFGCAYHLSMMGMEYVNQ